jgi:signal transduction histidine kinase
LQTGSRLEMDAPATDYRSALGLIAHELRSPAAIVSGYLRMLLQRDVERLSDQQRRMLDEAGRACGRVLRLIQEVGDLASLEGSCPVRSPSGVAVFPLCGEIVESAAREGGSPTPIFLCADADVSAVVDGDAAWLKRAFGALITATAREHGPAQLECHGFVSDESGSRQAVIACGPPGVAAKRDEITANRAVFDRWRGGTGVSLPIACRIIEAHGGSVWSPAAGNARAACVWALPIAASAAPGV